jgi:hypothetical protein
MAPDMVKGLVLYYSFDKKDQHRKVVDSSPEKNHGKNSGAKWTAEGRKAGAYEFDGSSDFIEVRNEPSLQITGDQTIAMWICVSSLNARRNPWAKAYGGEGTMTIEPGGSINYYYGTSGANRHPYTSVSMPDKLEEDKWAHVALVRDMGNKTIKWYKNGKKVREQSAKYRAAEASKAHLFIGRGYVNKFHGKLDEIMMFKRALSAEEILRIYSSTKGK